MQLVRMHCILGRECVPPDTYRLRKFSSEKGSASLETLLTLDLPRAIMSEDGEPSDEREDEGGPCGGAFESDPPCSPVGLTGMAGRWICDYARGLVYAYGRPQRVDQSERQ